MKVSVVIPLYKNTELFLSNFSHNISYIGDYEIIVVDDDSQEDIKKSLLEISPRVIYINNHKRLGFSKSVNIGCRKASGDLIILLNTDVLLFKNFSKKLFERFFEDNKLFGISFMQIEKDGSKVGKNKIFFENGLPLHSKAKDVGEGMNAWLEGGSCVLNRRVFLDLGGFREIYSPFYWEDVDLGYRAYAAGYKILFDPTTIVQHFHESTIGKYFSRKYIKYIAYRNQFLFTWCNITDSRYLLEHLLLLPINLIRFLIAGDLLGLKGFLLSITYIPSVLNERNKFAKLKIINDDEIYKLFK